MGVWSLGLEDSLEKERAAHSSILAWEVQLTEEPGGLQLQSMGLQKLGHDWVTKHLAHTHTQYLTYTVLYFLYIA